MRANDDRTHVGHGNQTGEAGFRRVICFFTGPRETAGQVLAIHGGGYQPLSEAAACPPEPATYGCKESDRRVRKRQLPDLGLRESICALRGDQIFDPYAAGKIDPCQLHLSY